MAKSRYKYWCVGNYFGEVEPNLEDSPKRVVNEKFTTNPEIKAKLN